MASAHTRFSRSSIASPLDKLVFISRPSPTLAWGGTVLWLGLAVWIVFGAGVTRDNLSPLLILMLPVAVFGPVAMIWALYRLAGSVARLSEDQASLSARVSKLATGAPRQPERPPAAMPQPVAAPAPAAATPAQPALKLADVPPEAPPPMKTSDMILALNFPQDAHDKDGFRALKQALVDESLKPVITAAQDVLTLLSQDGLYMDDLPPERAKPETWRRFARGERGAAVRGIGGIRAPEAIGIVSDRLRSDTIFRDTALHFLRIFDQLVTKSEPRMTDTELTRMGDTRSARAFMLIGRAIGTFD